MKRMIWILAAAPLLVGACTTAPSATTGAAELKTNNVTGTVSTTLPVGLDAAFKATNRAVEDLKFTPVSSASDALKGVVKAKTADGTSVEATLEKVGDTVTSLAVTAGPIKTDVARALAAKIQERAK